jgi:hypothetical protein
VPEGVRNSSGDCRSRFPLASNILQKTNTWQTTKKLPRTSQLARTWRASRHGADLSIYWAQGPPGTGAQSAPLTFARPSPYINPAYSPLHFRRRRSGRIRHRQTRDVRLYKPHMCACGAHMGPRAPSAPPGPRGPWE